MYDDDMISLAFDETSSVIDSGVTTNSTFCRDLCTSYTPDDFGVVEMGNNGVAKVVGICNVCLETHNSMKLFLKYVKHVPDIRLNLISTRKLNDDGYYSGFGNGQWKLTKGSLIIAIYKRNPNLYMMQAKILKDVIHAIENVDTIELWHKRFSYMSEKGIMVLFGKNYLSRMCLQKCAHCLAGKQNRVPFKTHLSYSRKENLLDLVHSYYEV